MEDSHNRLLSKESRSDDSSTAAQPKDKIKDKFEPYIDLNSDASAFFSQMGPEG